MTQDGADPAGSDHRLWPRTWVPSLFRRPPRANTPRRDVIAGIVLTGVLVPAGMGYAEVAGLPATTGLYATIAALTAYALIGPSTVLILGPDSSLVPIVAAALAPLAVRGSDRAVALAGLLAVLAGLVLAAAGLLRLGLLTDLLSKPVRLGYLNGLAATLVVSQLPKLFGFAVDGTRLTDTATAFVDDVLDGATRGSSLGVGAAALLTILLLRRRAPGMSLLVAVAGATVLVWLGGLDDEVAVVGALPRGVPSPALGGLGWNDVVSLLPAALGLALVASTDTAVLSRSIGFARHEEVDASHEMVALGTANVAAGLLGGFSVSASSTRTPVAMQSGARSQLAGLTGAALVLLLVVAVPGATTYLPSSALAAVVIVAAAGLADVPAVWDLYRARPSEFLLAAVSFLGVTLVGVIEGIGVAVVVSLVTFIARAWRPHRAELVRVVGRKGYHDRRRHPDGERIPGLVIARFDAPLFFANAGFFADFARALVADLPKPAQWLVVAAEPITDIDSSAAEVLAELDDYLAAQGTRLVFAEMKGPVKDRLARYGLGERFASSRQFPTLGTAVSAFISETGSDWTDWTER